MKAKNSLLLLIVDLLFTCNRRSLYILNHVPLRVCC